MTSKFKPSTNPMHQRAKIRTSVTKKNELKKKCPNPLPVEHLQVETPNIPAVPADLETIYRDRVTLQKCARDFAQRCKSMSRWEDLLNSSILHAMQKGGWGEGVEHRIKGILSSKAYNINRTRDRRKKAGTTFVSNDNADNDSGVLFSRPLTAEQVIARAASARAANAAIEAIVSGNPKLMTLVDLIGLGMRGSDICESMGISEIELASLRRLLKRRAAKVCDPLCVDGKIDGDVLVERWDDGAAA